MVIGNSSGGEGNVPAERARPTEKQDSSDKSSNQLRGSADKTAMADLNERTLADRNKEGRLGRSTAGRSNFGECDINDVKMCGKDKSTVVEMKNGLPEKINTKTQSWERDGNNPKLWHVHQGNEKFDLKADVKLVGENVTASVKYENGRQVTFKNGEVAEINHPNGESWKPNSEKPGRWDVTLPNKDNPSQPKQFSIQDVKVDAKNGDINWHVDKGAGAGQNREIDEHGKYHASLNSLKGAEKAADSNSTETEKPASKARDFVMRLNRPEGNTNTNTEKPMLQHLESLETVPKPQTIPKIEFPAPKALPNVRDHANNAHSQITAEKPHSNEVLPAKQMAEQIHQPTAFKPAENTFPKPQAPEQAREIPHPQPILKPIEQHLQPAPSPHLEPIKDQTKPAENLNASLEKFTQDNLARLKEMQDRMHRANENVVPSLQRITGDSLPIPAKLPEPKSLHALPVVQPAILDGPRTPLAAPTSIPQMDVAALPVITPSKIDLGGNHKTFEPQLRNSVPSFNPTAPELQVSPSSPNSRPELAPIAAHTPVGDNHAPVPQRAHSQLNSEPMAVPKISMGEKQDNKPEIQQAPAVIQEQHNPVANTHKPLTASISETQQAHTDNQAARLSAPQSGHPFKLGAQETNNIPQQQHVPNYPSPQYVYPLHAGADANHNAPLQARVENQGHKMQAHHEQKIEQHFALAGAGTIDKRRWEINPHKAGITPINPNSPVGTPVNLDMKDNNGKITTVTAMLGEPIYQNGRMVGRQIQIGNALVNLRIERI